MKWFLILLLAILAIMAICFIKLVFALGGVSLMISSNYKSSYNKTK